MGVALPETAQTVDLNEKVEAISPELAKENEQECSDDWPDMGDESNDKPAIDTSVVSPVPSSVTRSSPVSLLATPNAKQSSLLSKKKKGK